MTDTFAFAAGLAGACLIAGAGLAQDELAFPLDQAPEQALAVAQEAAPDVTFDTVDIEVEDGVITLEFSGDGSDGARREVDVAYGWRVLEVEEIIALEEVPEDVAAMLAMQLPDFAPTTVERSARGEGVVIYEFEGSDETGREIDVEVRSDGESIVILDDEET